jgi:hypothetical protein
MEYTETKPSLDNKNNNKVISKVTVQYLKVEEYWLTDAKKIITIDGKTALIKVRDYVLNKGVDDAIFK